MTRRTASPLAVLFDVDGCLISTGGAGTKAWRHAFERLHGIPADIAQFTEAGMIDPDVGRQTFGRVIDRDPTEQEMGRLLGAYLEPLAEEVEQSAGYRVMPGVEALLPRLVDLGMLLGIASGALEAAAHIKLGRARLNRFFSFGGYGSDSADRAELTRLAIARCGRLHGHALDPSRALVVGDTPRDMEAGGVSVRPAASSAVALCTHVARPDKVIAPLVLVPLGLAHGMDSDAIKVPGHILSSCASSRPTLAQWRLPPSLAAGSRGRFLLPGRGHCSA